ncbi:MAG: hypothetical protein ABI867_13025 [Kofleriaceae bacterium]
MTRRALPILLAGLACFVLYAYPGMMSIDSVDQLREARAGFYTDAHPPAMAALWRVLDAIVAGPFLMLLLQGITFLLGCYLVLVTALAPRKAAIVASVVLLVPPVITTMGFIWKDSVMAGTLVLGAGLLVSADRRVRAASLVCFTVATAVKYNAFAATLPLIVVMFEWRPRRRLVRYAIATATWLGVTLAATGINAALTDQPMHFWHSSLAVTDIAGVINYEGTMTDAELRRDLEGTELRITHRIQSHTRKLYATHQGLKLVLGKYRMWDLPSSGTVPAPVAQRDAIEAAWWRMVREHPSAYLRHRVTYFLDVLGITRRSEDLQDQAPPIMLERLDVPAPFVGQDRWQQFNNWYWQHTPVFWPWIYITMALVLLWVGRRQRLVVALLASGLVVEASLFLLAPSGDHRYSHWTIVVTILAAVILAARRGKDHAARPDLDTARSPV